MARGRGRPRRAGVSAFGVSGTNVHVILEEAPALGQPADPIPGRPPPRRSGRARPAALPPPADPWLVSARTAAGLAAQAGRLAAHVAARPDLDPADVALVAGAPPGRSSSTGPWSPGRAGRTGRRAGGGGGGRAGARGGDRRWPPIRAGWCSCSPARAASGPGWAGTWRRSCPVFAARLAECAPGAGAVTWTGTWTRSWPAAPLDRVDVVQPALWAVMVSLAAVWQAAGVVPDAVVGHSPGRDRGGGGGRGSCRWRTAPGWWRCAAGRCGRWPAGAGWCRWPSPRRRSGTGSPPGAGGCRWRRSTAPAATVVSGEPAALAELAGGVRGGRGTDPDAAGGLRLALRAGGAAAGRAPGRAGRDHPGPARIPMISAMTGQWLDGLEAEAGYWYRSLRSPVEFRRAVEALAEARATGCSSRSPAPGADRGDLRDAGDRRPGRSR